MATPEHLAILKKGTSAWNKWRLDHAGLEPDLRGANLSKADLSKANLSGAHLSGANLREANLGAANLSGAGLSKARLSRANLSAANLRAANLSGARLSKTNFSGASLNGANLSGTTLARADLRGADVSNATVAYTLFGDMDLRGVKGLLSVKHSGPSTIGIDTIYRSKGEIPQEFLRGAGVPEPFITRIKTLVGAMQPIQFYSCFISYSTQDQKFANHVHADLQRSGVRCWLATEDLKTGDKFRSRIEASIRTYDKLLLVLSKASLASPWVEDEVESALERERRESRLVLFPIRIDDAVLKTDVAWAIHLRRKRQFGEFSQWENHDAYKRAFERLVRDLKAEAQARGS